MKILIADLQRTLRVDPRWVARVARRAAAVAGLPAGAGELSVAFVDARRMARLNRRYTGHRGSTDVLAFDLTDEARSRRPWLGQVVLCPSVARRVCRRYGHTPLQELALYLIHGILHLAGYEDHERTKRRRMEAVQRRLLKELMPR
ncbi:MAG: rRNA maturation RNase YbeY [Candidatus Omnitrophica bacterium]|nr:rRNA maturation RNase YbeY [Candidatus Omnitrophota bacterium]